MNRPKQGGAYVLTDDGELETVTPPPKPPLLPHEEEAARDEARRAAEAAETLPQATVTVDGRPVPGTVESTTADPPASRRRRAPEPEAPQAQE